MFGQFVSLSVLLILNSCWSLKNLNVTKHIDVRYPVVRIEHGITVDISAKSYEFSIHPSEVPHVSFVSAWTKGDKSRELEITRISPSIYSINLGIISGNPVNFNVLLVLTNILEPKPMEILQQENQYLKYTGNILFYSPYPTGHLETSVFLPQGELLRYTTTPEPVKRQPPRIAYGPYYSVEQNSHIPLHVHFENNIPFLTVTKMTRIIEISHWGNIAVEETLEIKNQGAKLRGAFSRLDYDLGHGQKNAVVSFTTALPATAKDIYYRDEIGNISTSSVMELLDTVEVKLTPRFPLMGGWKTQYTLGYNVPAHEFLYRTGSQFTLRMRFLDHIFDNQIVEDLTVKIVLPELVSNIDFRAPFPIMELPREVIKTYLDTTGRTVLVYKANNLISEHIKEFTLNYQFHMIYMLREPLMLIMAFATVFACALVYVRLDFTIFKDEKTDLRMFVQALVDEAQTIYQDRVALYKSYDDCLNQYKAKKDSARLNVERRKLDADHKQVNHSLGLVQAKLSDYYAEGVEKLKELLTLDSTCRDMINERFQLAERLVTGKISKQQYQASDVDIGVKKSDLISRMDSIMYNL